MFNRQKSHFPTNQGLISLGTDQKKGNIAGPDDCRHEAASSQVKSTRESALQESIKFVAWATVSSHFIPMDSITPLSPAW